MGRKKMNLVIKNCNCINQADISIEPNCLNIKYAMNGTGKSTISKAILLKSQDEDALKEKLIKLRRMNNQKYPIYHIQRLKYSMTVMSAQKF